MVYFRSRWEANYARYMEYLREQGDVVSWAHEPKTFWFAGIKRGVTSYLPDFLVVYPDGREEYHEVKGWMDAKSATKIKRMARYHPDVVLRVVGTKEYTVLEREWATKIEGWELKQTKEDTTKDIENSDGPAKEDPEGTKKKPGRKTKKTEHRPSKANNHPEGEGGEKGPLASAVPRRVLGLSGPEHPGMPHDQPLGG